MKWKQKGTETGLALVSDGFKQAYGVRSLELSDEKVMCTNRGQRTDFVNGAVGLWRSE